MFCGPGPVALPHFPLSPHVLISPLSHQTPSVLQISWLSTFRRAVGTGRSGGIRLAGAGGRWPDLLSPPPAPLGVGLMSERGLRGHFMGTASPDTFFRVSQKHPERDLSPSPRLFVLLR